MTFYKIRVMEFTIGGLTVRIFLLVTVFVVQVYVRNKH